jgi:hypothetical protein
VYAKIIDDKKKEAADKIKLDLWATKPTYLMKYYTRASALG